MKLVQADFHSASICRLGHDEHDFLLYGIAEGETIVRLWNPEFGSGHLPAAKRRISKDFPCIHKVIIVDPSNAQATRNTPIYFNALPKIDHARYARDFA